MLKLQQIQKKYYETLILNIPQLELSPGIYWVQGGNGVGKTTCLKIIAGLIPFEGDVLVKNTVSSKKDPVRYRQEVNYAEAEPLYPGFLTGRDLLRLHTSAKGKGHEDITAMAPEMRIPAFLNNPVSSYSSGMLKKLSLLLAFTGAPSLILLDEPLITLDQDAIPVLYEWVRRFHIQHGVSFFITSHQLIVDGALPVTAALAIENKKITTVYPQ
jgi:ABC-2 type transport system ATP-binding protein